MLQHFRASETRISAWVNDNFTSIPQFFNTIYYYPQFILWMSMSKIFLFNITQIVFAFFIIILIINPCHQYFLFVSFHFFIGFLFFCFFSWIKQHHSISFVVFIFFFLLTIYLLLLFSSIFSPQMHSYLGHNIA